MSNIRLAKITDLKPLAEIYKELYDNSVLNEHWSIEKAFQLCNFYYTKQPDLFVVAEENNSIVGAVMSLVKPWFDGNRLIETEIFVSKHYQRRGIASLLFEEHFRRAMALYNVETIEAHTYQDKDGYPLKWYLEQGYGLIDELLIINGNVRQVYEYHRKNKGRDT